MEADLDNDQADDLTTPMSTPPTSSPVLDTPQQSQITEDHSPQMQPSSPPGPQPTATQQSLIEPTHSTTIDPTAVQLPPLLQWRAANPRRNAGVPPGEWWKRWEPTSPESNSNQQEHHNEEEDELTQVALSTRYADPQTFKEVMERPDKSKWLESMSAEMSNHLENRTWDIIELPRNAKVVGSKWVLHLKRLADGSIERHKSRVVAKGSPNDQVLSIQKTPLSLQSTVQHPSV